ncbi:MAG: hypothetical protein GXY38_03430 [Planctomycetes bacterium]|nr:hypothetical protein [Planctomycetota bacterium]
MSIARVAGTTSSAKRDLENRRLCHQVRLMVTPLRGPLGLSPSGWSMPRTKAFMLNFAGA